MIRKPYCFIVVITLMGILLTGCPKKVVKIPPIEAPPVRNPMLVLLEAFAAVESLESDASIRIDTVRRGGDLRFPLNGFVLYQKPDKLRILGYHPLGMGLFDALFIHGEFLILTPLQKKAYTGRVSDFEDLIEKAGLQISTEKTEGNFVPNVIRVALEERKTRVDIRLKNISINPTLPGDTFEWSVPEGVEIKPLGEMLKGKPWR